MKLEKIIVKGLFGVFNHEIVLKEHITILVSENGYGKTMILRMLKALFEYDIVFFHTVVFDEFILEFSTKKTISLIKNKDKDIYINNVLILNNENYQSEMLITVKNAYDERENEKLPEDISIIELIQSPDYTRFNGFKQMYNTREIVKKVRSMALPKVNTRIINTDRVDSFLGYRHLKESSIRNSQEVSNDVFTKTINSFLVHKKIEIQEKQVRVVSTLTNQRIPLINLSSGEKHLFRLFYDLILASKEDDFILLDEPEISLHISWQNKFIQTLQEIISVKPLNILIATHSPNIIDSHWKMVIELNEPINL